MEQPIDKTDSVVYYNVKNCHNLATTFDQAMKMFSKMEVHIIMQEERKCQKAEVDAAW